MITTVDGDDDEGTQVVTMMIITTILMVGVMKERKESVRK